MDVNVNAEVKGSGLSTAPVVQREERARAPIAPVEKSNDSSRAALDNKRLRKNGAAPVEPVSKEEVAEAVKAIQKRLDTMGTSLNFSVREEIETVVVQVTNKKSGDLVRQIPSEEILQLRQKLDELVGLLFDEKA